MLKCILAQVGPESIFHIIYMSLLKISVQNISGLTSSSQISGVTNLAGVCYCTCGQTAVFSPCFPVSFSNSFSVLNQFRCKQDIKLKPFVRLTRFLIP